MIFLLPFVVKIQPYRKKIIEKIVDFSKSGKHVHTYKYISIDIESILIAASQITAKTVSLKKDKKKNRKLNSYISKSLFEINSDRNVTVLVTN